MNEDKNKKQQSDLTNTSKKSTSDTSNSLKRDAQGDPGVNNYTPKNETDNEQGTEKKR